MRFFWVALSLLVASPAFSLTPEEMVAKADAYRMPSGDLRYLVTITEFNGATQLRVTRYRVSFSPTDKIRADTLFPVRSVGRNFLMIGNDMWLQTPDIQRPTRISFQQRLTGEVSNGDIARTHFASDYHAQKLGEETVEGRKAIKLLLKARSKDVTYAAIHYWLEAGSFKPIQAEFLTSEMKPLKRGIYSKPKKIFDRVIFTQLELTDAINPKRRSIMDLSHFTRGKFRPGSFNKESLRNGDDF